MPDFDLSDATLEPSFMDDFVVKRRQQIMNNFGEAGVDTTLIPSFGTVTIAGDNALAREADQQHAGKTIHIVCQFRLRGASKDYQPDLVRWHGDDFIVRKVEDYSGYGAGWIQAECTSIDFMDEPPSPSIGVMIFSNPQNSSLVGVLACC